MRKRATWAAIVAVLSLILAACSATASPHRSVAEPGDYGNVEATAPGPASAPHCGIERWAVKTGNDVPESGKVNLTDVHDTTVAAMDQLVVPAGFTQDSTRMPGVEYTVYRVHAVLREYKMEADSDYHLVLTDGASTMIAEIPSPACVNSDSPFLPGITAARDAFNAQYAPGNFWQPAGVPVTVTGVGFFDTPHGQTGVAPNAIEIHPVLSITFDGQPSPPPTFGPATQPPVAPASTSARLLSGAPECVTIAVVLPSGSRTWLEFCGSTGPGSDSPVRDPLAGKSGVLDGAVAIGNGCGSKAAPCVIFGPN